VVGVLRERLDKRGGELVDRGAATSSTPSRASVSTRIACSTLGSWRNCGTRSAATTLAARLLMRRCRPPRRNAVSTRALDTVNPSAGLGAIASTARASPLASWVVESPRPEPDPAANAARKPG